VNRWLRRTALASSAVAMSGVLVVIGAAVGSPPEQAVVPIAQAPSVLDPLSRSIAGLQKSLQRSPRNARAWSDLGLA
jgi:hypothetical protein